MTHIFRHAILLASSLYLTTAIATPTSIDLGDLPQLQQQEQHAKVAKRVSDLFSRSHYKYIPLDDGLSQKVFERYIEQLDYNKLVFTQADIDELKVHQFSFDDNLKSGQLDPAYIIYQLNTTRRYQRYIYALSLLNNEIKFVDSDHYEYDRSESPWAKDEQALDKLWQQRVKSDALTLKLSGKEWPEIKKQLSKRYKLAIKRLSQTESEDVFQSFMNAYAHTIEPHTSYLSPRNSERFKTSMSLSLEGIGASLSLEDDYTVVRGLVKGGPAARSKQLFKDDKIVGVGQDGEKIIDVIGWRLDDIVELIKGPKGTKVQLEVLTEDKSRIIEIVREQIQLEDREAKSSVEMIDGNKIGVITIPSFYMQLSEHVEKEINKLKAQKVKGIVIDLRNNGGGALSEATLLTGLFIKSGPVVQVRDSLNKIEIKEDVNNTVSYTGPLTVLINRYSASASEIFAAALQDYGRAIVIGEQSFGKGTVQQNRPIARFYDKDKELIGTTTFTIAKFYRINGGSTQHKGVIPDIVYPSAIAHQDTGESLEKNALPWDNIKSADFQAVNKVGQPLIKQLIEQHTKRIKQEVEFSYILQDIEEYKAEKDKTTISLVESERIKLREEKESSLLQRNNERLIRAGLKPVKDLDDIPEDFELLDALLKEAAAITLDLARA